MNKQRLTSLFLNSVHARLASLRELQSAAGEGLSALGETIRLMGEVDEVIDVNGGWPIQ